METRIKLSFMLLFISTLNTNFAEGGDNALTDDDLAGTDYNYQDNSQEYNVWSYNNGKDPKIRRNIEEIIRVLVKDSLPPAMETSNEQKDDIFRDVQDATNKIIIQLALHASKISQKILESMEKPNDTQATIDTELNYAFIENQNRIKEVQELSDKISSLSKNTKELSDKISVNNKQQSESIEILNNRIILLENITSSESHDIREVLAITANIQKSLKKSYELELDLLYQVLVEKNVTEVSKKESVTKVPKEENVTKVPKEENVTEVPKEQNITMVPKEEIVTKIPKEENVTEVPKEENITMVPIEKIVTKVPKEGNVTEVPKEENITMVPKEETVTKVPKEENVTEVPKEENITMVPKEEIVTKVPTEEDITMKPQEKTVTEALRDSLCDLKVPSSIVTKHDIWKKNLIPEKDDLDIYMINKTGCSYAAVPYNDNFGLTIATFDGNLLEWRLAVRAQRDADIGLTWDHWKTHGFTFFVGRENNTVSSVREWEHWKMWDHPTPGLLSEDRYVPVYIKMYNGMLSVGHECDPRPFITTYFSPKKGQSFRRLFKTWSPRGAKYLYNCPPKFIGI